MRNLLNKTSRKWFQLLSSEHFGSASHALDFPEAV